MNFHEFLEFGYLKGIYFRGHNFSRILLSPNFFFAILLEIAKINSAKTRKIEVDAKITSAKLHPFEIYIAKNCT